MLRINFKVVFTVGINGLMAEVMENHIRLHLLSPGRKTATPELAEDLIEIVRAYLK